MFKNIAIHNIFFLPLQNNRNNLEQEKHAKRQDVIISPSSLFSLTPLLKFAHPTLHQLCYCSPSHMSCTIKEMTFLDVVTSGSLASERFRVLGWESRFFKLFTSNLCSFLSADLETAWLDENCWICEESLAGISCSLIVPRKMLLPVGV